MQPYGFTHPDFAPCTRLVEEFAQALEGRGIAASKAKTLAWERARILEPQYLENFPDAPPMTQFEQDLALLCLQLDGMSYDQHHGDLNMSDLRCSAMEDQLMRLIRFYAGQWALQDMGLLAWLLLLWGRLTGKHRKEGVRSVWAPWSGRAPPPYGPQVILRQ
jgi:hypothetical protein